MSFSIDITEYTFAALEKEIKSRQVLFDEGRCTYCGRKFSSPPACQYTDRHSGKTP